MELLMIAVCNLFSLYVFADSKSMVGGISFSLWREMSGFYSTPALGYEREENRFHNRQRRQQC